VNIRDVLRPTHSERSSITFPWSWYGPVAYDSQVRYIYEDVSKLTKDAGYPVYNYYYLPSHSIDFGGNQSRWLVLFLLEHSQEKGAKILRFFSLKDKDIVQFIAWNCVKCCVAHLIDFTSYSSCTNAPACTHSDFWNSHISILRFRFPVSTLLHFSKRTFYKSQDCRSQWPRGLRFGSAAVLLLNVFSNPGGGMDALLLWMSCVYAPGWLIVQRSSNKCGFSESDREASIKRRSWPKARSWVMEKKNRWLH